MRDLSLCRIIKILAWMTSVFYPCIVMAQTDVKPPKLNSFELKTPVIYASDSVQYVDMDYVASDDLSGLDRLRGRFVSVPTGQTQFLLPRLSFNGEREASSTVTLEVPADAPAGTYNFVFNLRDKSGNSFSSNTSQPALGATLEIKANQTPRPRMITIDAGKTCMPWFILGTPNPAEFGNHCAGYSPGVGGTVPQPGFVRGTCEVELPEGDYTLRYGGHSGANIRVDDTGRVSYRTGTSQIAGLIPDQNLIAFETEPVGLERRGFPGRFNVSLDDQPCANDPDPIARRERIYILRGARFMVAGDWTTGTVTSNSNTLQMSDTGQLTIVRPAINGFADPFVVENSPMRISPNPYYWMRTPGSSADLVSQALSSEQAQAVLIVKGESCPAGFNLWADAKGRFLLSATKRGEAGVKIGGEARVTLTRDQMPQHSHSNGGRNLVVTARQPSRRRRVNV